jgi:hypothetical protein
VQPLELDYEPVRAAIARGDLAAVEAHARKLRDEHFANLVRRAATSTYSCISKLFGQVGGSRLDVPASPSIAVRRPESDGVPTMSTVHLSG